MRSLEPPQPELPGLRSLPLVENAQTLRRLLARELAADGVDADAAEGMLRRRWRCSPMRSDTAAGCAACAPAGREDRFVCEIADGGPGLDDPFAGYIPPRRRGRSRSASGARGS